MKVSDILSSVDLGRMALPEFQRGYVWNRNQVRGLMSSLYRRYPVGSLLVWLTDADDASLRGEGQTAPGIVELLLDGQQRITSLYGVIRGKAPKFFEGDAKAFTGLRFHLDTEAFEFYQPVKMKDDPLWIDVTALFQSDAGQFVKPFIEQAHPQAMDYLNRLNTVRGIADIDFHVEQVTGQDKSVDEVVEIFNRLNSGGTKLKNSDLALAKVCASWPEARDEMNTVLARWRDAGYHFRLEWLLRNVNTIKTGEAKFTAMSELPVSEVKDGLVRAEKHVDSVLNLIGARLGLDHDRVLGSRSSFPLLTTYLDRRGGTIDNAVERDKLLYWYVHTILWGRYAGSTETVLDQDLAHIEEIDGALDRLVGQLQQNRGDLTVRPNDFHAWSVGSRFYPLLYLLTRTQSAIDWDTGVPLSKNLLGKQSTLEVHHIFPKSLLYKADFKRSEVNALGNFTFLTKSANLHISNRLPSEYLPEIEERHPGALASHWIPMDESLWQIDRFRDFLDARRALLADAANALLESLWHAPVAASSSPSLVEVDAEAAGGIKDGDEQALLEQINDWVVEQGLPEGVISHEVMDPDLGTTVAIADLAWPEGLQPGLSQPVALLIDETTETMSTINEAGYRYFTTAEQLQRHIERDVLAMT